MYGNEDARAEIHLGKLSRREFRARMQSGELQCCIIPVAAIEQHLEHLAMEHDWRSACHMAESVALQLAPAVLVAEGVMVGISEHHMNHPGTLSLRSGTFLAVLTDLIDSVVRAGFRNVLVLNGHGGNMAACQAVWEQMLRQFQINLHFLSYWDVLNAEDARNLLKSGSRIPEDLPGHAQEFETAIGLALFPENVRTSAVSDQPDSSPALATAATGVALVECVVERLVAYVQEMMEGERTVEIPPFFP